MDRIELVITNADDVIFALRNLGLEASAVLGAAYQAGADVLADSADGFAPGPNNTTETVEQTETQIEIRIGPDEAHWYYLFAETGTSPHEVLPKEAAALLIDGQLRARANPKGTVAKPFLRPAADTSKDDVAGAVAGQFRNRLTS